MLINHSKLNLSNSKIRDFVKTLDFLTIAFFELGFYSKFDGKVLIFSSYIFNS